MSVEQHPHFTLCLDAILVPNLRETAKQLGFFKNVGDDLLGGIGIIGGNIVVNVQNQRCASSVHFIL